MQTSNKPEKMYQTKKRDLMKLSEKEREEHEQRQAHKRKHHKPTRGSRPEWEAY